jgi:hypothetical protein
MTSEKFQNFRCGFKTRGTSLCENKHVMKQNLFLGLIVVAVLSIYRILPHPPNFAPFAAIAFITGMAGGWRPGLALTLGSLFLSDLAINAMLLGEAFYPGRIVDYAAFVLICLGAAKARGGIATKLSMAFATPVVFFLISNFGVWLFGRGLNGLPYGKSLEGLLSCYVAGLPFLANSALGDWFFMLVLIGCFRLAGVSPRRVQPDAIRA